jgi:membrane protease YdiL (CAAX protease family)
MDELREITQAFTAWDWACVACNLGLGLLGLYGLRRWLREAPADRPPLAAWQDAALGLIIGCLSFGLLFPLTQVALMRLLFSDQLVPSLSSQLLMGLVGQVVAAGVMVATWTLLRQSLAWSPSAPAPAEAEGPAAAFAACRPRDIGWVLVLVLGLGLGGAVLWKGIHAGWSVAARHGFPFPAPVDEPQQIVQFVMDTPVRSRTFAVMTATIVLGAPIMEELAFRGMIYPALKRLLPFRFLAILGTGLLFSAVHESWSAALPLLGFGALLCLVRDRYGLVTCIGVHATFNALNLFWMKLAPNAANL